MIPLPEFLYNQLSGRLQLLSSQLGAGIIDLLGISVFVEGNVIDLGVYKLQVVEACDGLRYLFPLMTIAFITAYFFKDRFWKKAVILLSSIPIAILMNSFRIGMIGILVEHFGTKAAEGFLHFFEGWVVFMLCILILIGEMWLLAKIGGRRHLGDLFRIESDPPPSGASVLSSAQATAPATWRLSRPFVTTIVVLAASALLATSVEAREDARVPRKTFVDFPLSIEEWRGQDLPLEQVYIDTLKFDDYMLIDYRDHDGGYINLYAAFYASQRKGQSAHSPRSCIPGGGWEITSLSMREIPALEPGAPSFRVNRALIQRGRNSQVVYYWFKQRDRHVTNEYLVKWYLLWDALTRNRTDGALVRLVSFPHDDEDLDAVDRRLTTFAAQVAGHLGEFVPN